ncbi:MAG: glycosyltransferase family 8 protein [Spirochaetia bacterium]|nr:glycosyltransferase family 8 protein [Spirochaetia bacterium]
MENNDKNVIPIFFATDNNYAPFLAVALTSLLDNASKDYFYKIYVLTTSLKREYAEQLNLICHDARPDGASIEFVSLGEEMEKSSGNFHLRDYYSKETYCRVFIPRVFSQYDKVLYLDCDIVVTGDISELYNIDIGDNILGAASEEVMMEYDVFGTYVEKALGIPREDYFSAGVLLINAKKYREDDIESKFIKLMNTYTFRVTQDEDYLNVLCQGKVKMVDLGWNKSAFKSDKFDDKNLKLIHYKINWKPWHYDNVYYEEFFWKYARKTFLYDNILKIKASYTEDLHERDNLAFENLVKMAIEDSNNPNNYCNSTKAKK